MASGVAVDDECVTLFNDMKMKKNFEVCGQKKRLKAVVFCVNDTKDKIVVEHGNEVYVGNADDHAADQFADFIKMLPKDNCRYVLYDFCYCTKDSKKEELVFMTWNPDSCCVKNKMIYASSVECFKKKLSGLKHVWQISDMADLLDCRFLADKLGSDVVSLEGRDLSSEGGQQQRRI